MLLILARTTVRALRAPRTPRAATTARYASADAARKRVVFLGSPDVAALTLDALLDAAAEDRGGGFDVVAAVSQPPAPKGRKRVLQPCDVQALAEARGVPCLTPASARDPEFLEELAALEPDVCVTAAYGQFLPKKFLAIPALGTLNIHPSLLPRWRGAAPVQRSLEAGDADVGVTVLQTVLKMDAGPVAAQSNPRPVVDGDDAPGLLDELFSVGARLLIDDVFPKLWTGDVPFEDQDPAGVVEAPKLTRDEGALAICGAPVDGRSLSETARDKVRAFRPWPGTFVDVSVDGAEPFRLKVLDAAVSECPAGVAAGQLAFEQKTLVLPCADGSALALGRVQAPNKKPTDGAGFWNGLRGADCVVREEA